MNCQSEKYSFDLAADDDSPSILRLLEEESSGGAISLTYTRRPDPIVSFRSEGECEIYVGRECVNGEITSMGVCDIRELFIDGKAQKVGYFHALRVFKKYRGMVPVSPFIKKSLDRLGAGTNCFIATALKSNKAGREFLEKDRVTIPKFGKLCVYDVIALATKSRSINNSDYNFVRSNENSIERVIDYIIRKGREYLFFPAITVDQIRGGGFPSLSVDDFYFLENKKGEIVAAGAAWDQASYKQYIVESYSSTIKALSAVSHAASFVGLPRLPRLPSPGSNLEFFTLSFWSADTIEIFSHFLDKISTALTGYPFFLVGISENHPFVQVFKQRRKIKYTSVLYVLDLENQSWHTQSHQKDRIPCLECGLL